MSASKASKAFIVGSEIRGKLNPYEFTVYGILASYAGKKMKAFPKIETLAKNCLMSESSVKRALESLKEKGWIKVENQQRKSGGNTANLYHLQGVSIDHTETSDSSERPIATALEEPALKGFQLERCPLERKIEKKKKPEFSVSFHNGFSTPEFKAAWKLWDGHRKESSGKGWTPTAQKLAMHNAEALYQKLGGADKVIEAITYSIEKGWKKIYPAPADRPAAKAGYRDMLTDESGFKPFAGI